MSKYLEIEFKGKRLNNYELLEDQPFEIHDFVVLESDNGIDVGRIHRFLCDISPSANNGDIFKILRKATEQDLDKLKENRQREEVAKPIARRLFKKHNLDIKLSEVEFQLDRNKVTFYFTSDERVDFRDLVKELAQEFKARIELRQINSREAARKIGGCGVCGLELCCTTCILRDFSPISTQNAKDQMMSANPSKLTGMCGRLRCCLRYELEMYKSELQRYPEIATEINTPAGKAMIDKIDIFHEKVYLRFLDGNCELLPMEDVQLLMAN